MPQFACGARLKSTLAKVGMAGQANHGLTSTKKGAIKVGRCIAALIAFAVPWFATWVLIVIIAAGIVTGPIGWAILVAIVGAIIGIALLAWAFNECSRISSTRG
jgi:hypothetical protein